MNGWANVKPVRQRRGKTPEKKAMEYARKQARRRLYFELRSPADSSLYVSIGAG
jgi:hypothetical protein